MGRKFWNGKRPKQYEMRPSLFNHEEHEGFQEAAHFFQIFVPFVRFVVN